MLGKDALLLVVDGDSGACNALQQIISSSGIRADCISNPLQVLDRVKSSFYNVILLDVNMPEKSGLNLLSEIVKASPDTKVIIVSGCGDKESAIKALSLGAFDFLEKPFDYKLITHSIERAIQTQKIQLAYRYEKKKLQDVNRQLIETNKALSTLTKNIERTRKGTEAAIEQKIRASILPIIDKLQHSRNLSLSDQRDLELLNNLLNDLTSTLDAKHQLHTLLTPTELRIAQLIRNRLTTEEIANHMHVSPETVKSHRKNIRKKLGLSDSNHNLGAHLKAGLDE